MPADGERDVDERDELLEDDDADDGERRLGAGAGAGCGATILNCDASWPAIAINFAWTPETTDGFFESDGTSLAGGARSRRSGERSLYGRLSGERRRGGGGDFLAGDRRRGDRVRLLFGERRGDRRGGERLDRLTGDRSRTGGDRRSVRGRVAAALAGAVGPRLSARLTLSLAGLALLSLLFSLTGRSLSRLSRSLSRSVLFSVS